MEVLDRLLELLPAGFVDLAYEAMARDLHVAAAAVSAVMLATALALAALLRQRGDQPFRLAGDDQPPRVGAELGRVAGGPIERGPRSLRQDGEDHRRHPDAELGSDGLVLRQQHDQRWDAGRGRRWPDDARPDGAAQAQVGALGKDQSSMSHAPDGSSPAPERERPIAHRRHATAA